MSTVSMASQQARHAILSKLRAVTAERPTIPTEFVTYFNDPAPEKTTTQTQTFIERARAWHAEVIETDTTTWPAVLADVLRHHQISTLLAGRDSAIAGTLAATPLPATVRWYDDDLSEFKTELFNDIGAGITTTLGAIAETGSLLLRPSKEEPRTLSLVPPVHIALLHERDLHETLLQALRECQSVDAMPTNLLLITGPSKTADIQRMLVYGVHGPKALVILLVRDAVTESVT